MDEFEIGDLIRMIPDKLDGYLVAYQKQIKDREALVEHIFCYAGETKKRYRVIWQKRNGRGKEFSEILHSVKHFEVVCTKSKAQAVMADGASAPLIQLQHSQEFIAPAQIEAPEP